MTLGLRTVPPPNHDSVVGFLEGGNAKVANTFSELCSPGYCSDPHTFTPSAGGSKVRIDYFVTENRVGVVSNSISSDFSFSLEDEQKDHTPICAKFCVGASNGSSCMKRRVVGYDVKKFGNVGQCRGFEDCVRNLPSVPVYVDNTSHCHIIDHNVYEALCFFFPRGQAEAQKAHIEEDTLSCLSRSARVRREMFRYRSRFDKSPLRAVFGFWAGKTWWCCWDEVVGFSCLKNLTLWQESRVRFRICASECKCLLQRDKVKYFCQISEEIIEAYASGSSSAMHKSVNKLIRICKSSKKTQKYSRVHDSGGVPAKCLLDERQLFRYHFSELLGGATRTFETLVVSDRVISSDRYEGVEPTCLPFCVPAPVDIMVGYNGLTNGKACGENRICTNVHKRFSRVMSELYFPLILKSYVRVQPPLQWKGGMLCELFKNKGSPSQCGNYRDILLADDGGKGAIKLIRPRFLSLALNIAHQSQYGGGFNGGETAFAQIYMRLVVDASISNLQSCGILYLDVVAAFATMLRRIVFDFEEGDEIWLHSLAVVGFSDSDIKVIYDSICDYAWIHDMLDENSHNDPNSTCNIDYQYVSQLCSNSWVSQEYIPNIVNVTKGSGAGTPLADLLYSMCMSRVITALRRALQELDLESSVCVAGSKICIRDVSYVDDVAIPITCCADQLSLKISKVANCAYVVYFQHGMKLNFNPGKSEVTVGFVGKNSKAARRNLVKEDDKISISAGSFNFVRVVPSYQHVGTMSPIAFDVRDEAIKRCGIMRSESRLLSRHIVKVKEIPSEKKISTLQTYVLSKGLFQCSTWPALNDTLYKRFHSTVLGIYRDCTGNGGKMVMDGGALCFDVGSMFNDDDVIYQNGFMCPKTMLRFSRLSLFVRIVRKSPPGLIEFMQQLASCNHAKGWVATVVGDLRWLELCEDFAFCQGFNLNQWVGVVAKDPRRVLSSIRRFCKSPFANITTQWADSPVLKTFAAPLHCYECGATSMSFQAHSVHLARKHGIKSKFRRYVDGHVCRVCLVSFGSRERCLNHVRYRSHICRLNHILRGPVIDRDQADSLDLEEASENSQLYSEGLRRHAAKVPCIQTFGPLLPIVVANPSSHHPLGWGHNTRL